MDPNRIEGKAASKMDTEKPVTGVPVVSAEVVDTPQKASAWKWAMLTASGLSLITAVTLFGVSTWFAERTAVDMKQREQYNETSERLASGVWLCLTIAVISLLLAQWV